MNILLRTVCGCERIIAIPNRHYPPDFRVAFHRGMFHALTFDPDTMGYRTDHGFGIRKFEDTGTTGLYGYRVYLEVL